jgi:hypothetical protein
MALNIERKTKKSKITTLNRGFLFYFLKWFLIVGIIFNFVKLVTKPMIYSWSKNYTEVGDQYLAENKYLSASVEYDKAVFLNNKNTAAKSNSLLAEQAQLDVTKLSSFYFSRGETDKATLSSNENFNSQDPVSLLNQAKNFLDSGDFQLSIVAAKKATELHPTLRDGWLYLGIANLKTAENIEMIQSNRELYLKNSKEALMNAKNIDSKYQPTLEYLDEVDSQLK